MLPQATDLDAATPGRLADALQAMLQSLTKHDRDVADVLTDARGRLRALEWDRFVRQQTIDATRHWMRRRHKELTRRRVVLASLTYRRLERVAKQAP